MYIYITKNRILIIFDCKHAHHVCDDIHRKLHKKVLEKTLYHILVNLKILKQ